jgi:hypothetical protein
MEENAIINPRLELGVLRFRHGRVQLLGVKGDSIPDGGLLIHSD